MRRVEDDLHLASLLQKTLELSAQPQRASWYALSVTAAVEEAQPQPLPARTAQPWRPVRKLNGLPDWYPVGYTPV